MPNENGTPGIGPAIILGAVTFSLGIIVTLLGLNMQEVNTKADKTDAGDRWTGTMERIKQECDGQLEGLRSEREALRDASASNALLALDWKSQYSDCENRWRLHLEVCKCGKNH